MPAHRRFLGEYAGCFAVVRDAGVHPGDHSRQYVFRCKRGHEFVARGTLVRARMITRCPDCKREDFVAGAGKPRRDLRGIRIGALVAVEPAGLVTSNGNAIWRFVADCGCTILVDSHRVRMTQRGKRPAPTCKKHSAKGGKRAA